MRIKKYIKLIAAGSLIAGIFAVAGPAFRTSAVAVVCPSTNKVTAASISPSGTATFTVAPGCHNIQLSLVSYTAPSNTFDTNTADQQVVFDSKTDNFDAGLHTWTVSMPDCYFQADLVYGTVIEHLGPAGSNNFYGTQGRLITAINGGTQACGGQGGGEEGNVTLCHATSSTTNPYVQITIDENGAYHAHYTQHQGPVFGPGVSNWGDIIPPFTFDEQTYSLNWTTAGMAIYNNDCMPVEGGQGGGGTDVCTNIEGVQTEVPTGMTADNQGNCTTPTGGQGGGPTTTTTTGQVLGTSTTAGSGSAQVAVVPQGSVNGGFGAASKALDHSSLVGLVGALLSVGSGLVMLNRRQS